MAGPDREKALDMALAQIDKNFGKGSVMRLGDEVRDAALATAGRGRIASCHARRMVRQSA